MTEIPIEILLYVFVFSCIFILIVMAVTAYQLRSGAKGIQKMVQEDHYSQLSPKSKEALKVSVLSGIASVLVMFCYLIILGIILVVDTELSRTNFYILFLSSIFIPFLVSGGIAFTYKWFSQGE